jgi:hypothetical protein
MTDKKQETLSDKQHIVNGANNTLGLMFLKEDVKEKINDFLDELKDILYLKHKESIAEWEEINYIINKQAHKHFGDELVE